MAQPIDTQEHEHSHLSTVEAPKGIMTGRMRIAWHQHGLSCRGALLIHDDILFAIGNVFRASTLHSKCRRFVRLEMRPGHGQNGNAPDGNGHTTQATLHFAARGFAALQAEHEQSHRGFGSSAADG